MLPVHILLHKVMIMAKQKQVSELGYRLAQHKASLEAKLRLTVGKTPPSRLVPVEVQLRCVVGWRSSGKCFEGSSLRQKEHQSARVGSGR